MMWAQSGNLFLIDAPSVGGTVNMTVTRKLLADIDGTTPCFDGISVADEMIEAEIVRIEARIAEYLSGKYRSDPVVQQGYLREQGQHLLEFVDELAKARHAVRLKTYNQTVLRNTWP